MNKEDLLQTYDKDEYKKLCVEAYEKAPQTASCRKVGDTFSSMIPHDISEALWSSDVFVNDKIDLLFDLFNDMPCYAYLMYLAMEYKYKFDEVERKVVHQKFISILSSSNEALKVPVLYSLWCDYFEDVEVCESMWNGLIEDCKKNESSIESMLEFAGPVIWALKIELFNYLVQNERWHEAILTCIYNSMFDAYGDINKTEAKFYIEKLVINRNSESYRKLMTELWTK